MHSALQLVPMFAAEKSKVAYYVAGGTLVAWALVVSIGLGLRRPEFPGGLGGQRVVVAITAVLVLATLSTAVLTSGGEAKAGGTTESGAPPPAGGAGAGPAGPAPAGAPEPPSTSSQPTATTGTPAPPSSPAGKGASSLKLAASPGGQLSFDTKQLSAKAGKVTIDFSNASPLEHNVTIAQGSTVLGATPTFTGASKSLTLTLKPGTYTFYCSVPGHRQAGMEGTLRVS